MELPWTGKDRATSSQSRFGSKASKALASTLDGSKQRPIQEDPRHTVLLRSRIRRYAASCICQHSRPLTMAPHALGHVTLCTSGLTGATWPQKITPKGFYVLVYADRLRSCAGLTRTGIAPAPNQPFCFNSTSWVVRTGFGNKFCDQRPTACRNLYTTA